jgi:hypothetical protein
MGVVEHCIITWPNKSFAVVDIDVSFYNLIWMYSKGTLFDDILYIKLVIVVCSALS